ncbi:MAG: LysM peptidoglycan-binding domain-containing protein [Rikenellaceae bacterium]
MSKSLNAFCITASFALLTLSCSTIRQNNYTSGELDVEEQEFEAYIDSLDRLAVQAAEAEAAIFEYPTITDSMESLYNSLYSDDEAVRLNDVIISGDPAASTQQIFFSSAQSNSVKLAEYRNMIFDDIQLNLRTENACYPADGHVTSPYGWRKGRMHEGIDLKAQVGDNIYAAFDGVVRLAKYNGAYGNCLVIRHYNGLETVYGHASKLLVKVNDVVKGGDVVALAGNTGRSTGSHLHFEVRAGGNLVNPTYILDTDKRQIRDTTLYVTMRNGRVFTSINPSEEEREAEILKEISIRYYTVRSGDNLSAIASRNGTNVTTLCRLNGISSKSVLRIGQRLIVRDGITVAKKTTTASTDSTATKVTTTTTTKATTTTAPATKATTTYTVKKGDTLGKIAKNNGTTIADLCALNGISRNTTLQIGQRLKVSGTGASSTQVASSATPTYYKVQKGDTLDKIAKKHGTTISEICRLSGISSRSTLQIGQRLTINGSASAPSTAASTSSAYHTIKSGDTLSEIAKKYGTTVSAICSLNGISKSTTLQLNRHLRVN